MCSLALFGPSHSASKDAADASSVQRVLTNPLDERRQWASFTSRFLQAANFAGFFVLGTDHLRRRAFEVRQQRDVRLQDGTQVECVAIESSKSD
jgi:hypothetical protein